MNEAILDAASNVIANCMRVKPDERFLLLTDDGKLDLAKCFFEAAKALGLQPVLLSIPTQIGGELPPLASSALLNADVAMILTTGSFTHTKGRAQASEKGVRIASMPTLTEEIAAQTLNANFDEIAQMSIALADKLTACSTIRVTTELGTDLTLHCSGRQGLADTGKLDFMGAFGNLPAGEAMVAPIETMGDGKLVVDGVVVGLGILASPLTLTFRDGRIVDVQGDMAQSFQDFVGKFDDTAWQIAEFGIGTNPDCRIMGNPLVDEKIFGTIHIACGNNLFMGGQQGGNMHYDMIVQSPTVYLDGNCVIEKGVHLPFHTR